LTQDYCVFCGIQNLAQQGIFEGDMPQAYMTLIGSNVFRMRRSRIRFKKFYLFIYFEALTT
jgi:hypothetical protein